MAVARHVQRARAAVGEHRVQRALPAHVHDVRVRAVHQQQLDALLHLRVVRRLRAAAHPAPHVPQQHVERRVAGGVAYVDVRAEAVRQRELRGLDDARCRLGAVQLVQHGAGGVEEDGRLEVGAVVQQEDGAVRVRQHAHLQRRPPVAVAPTHLLRVLAQQEARALVRADAACVVQQVVGVHAAVVL